MSSDQRTGITGAAETPPSDAFKTASRPWAMLATILFTAWACFHFPRSLMTVNLDDSWAGVLVYAREHRLQFGRDIVFTYGPLGFLSIEVFRPYAIVTRIIFEIVLGLGIATGICLAAWRMPLPWRITALGFFIFVTLPTHWGGDSLLLDEGLFAWGLLCFLESGRRLWVFVAALVVLAAIAALVKFTFLVAGVFTIGLLACHFAVAGRRPLAAGMVGGFVLGFLAIWMSLGQALSGVGAFLANSYQIAAGYNTAMGLYTLSLGWMEVMTGLALIAVIAAVISSRPDPGPRAELRRRIRLIWLVGLVFQSWKYGCVRADYNHLTLMLGFMPLLALFVAAIPAAGFWAAMVSRAAAIGSAIAACLFLHGPLPGFYPATLAAHTFQSMADSFHVIFQPAHYIRERSAASQAGEEKYDLPKIRAAVGGATVDLFGQNQSFALFNRFNYRPRPVFQSYSVYSRRLMELNERFYLSDRAPEYVIFNISPLDGRFGPLEDALVLKDILANYEMVLTEKYFLLLRRKGIAPPGLTLIKQGEVGAGEKIDLQDYHGTNLWLEIGASPSFIGRLEQFFYSVPQIRLVLWSRTDLPPAVTFGAPEGMLSAGFVASPAALDTTDVWAIYSGDKVRWPDAYSVDLSPSPPAYWNPRIKFRLYTIGHEPPGETPSR